MAAPGLPMRLDKLAAFEEPAAGSATGDETCDRMVDAGMQAEVVQEKRAMIARAAQRLLDEGVESAKLAHVYWVPGRVEVAGKHTDYAGGRSLLAAISKGFVVVSVDRHDALCRIFTVFGLSKEQRVAHLEVRPDLVAQTGHWSAYPAVVIRRLARNFGIRCGVDIAVESDLPEASGMSTSSAVICWMWLVLSARNGIQEHPKFQQHLSQEEALFTYLGFIENGQSCGSELPGDNSGVGTFGGSEDHTAIMGSEPLKLKLFSYCPTRHEQTVDFPSHWAFVIAVSGALAEKTGEAMESYNDAAFLARDAAAAWVAATKESPLAGGTFIPSSPNLAEVVQHVRVQLGDAATSALVRAQIGETIEKAENTSHAIGAGGEEDVSGNRKRGALRQRFEHFFDESELLTGAIAAAFAAEDTELLGQLADESHRLTMECLCNTLPETAWLPQEARRQGAIAASAFGAGFGGSCWALVEGAAAATDFAKSWLQAYNKEFPRWEPMSSCFVMTPGPGAFVVH